MTTQELQQTAQRIRASTFKAIAEAGGGHFGGSLSLTEILTALYFNVLRIDPCNHQWDERDRFILSKGHGGPALYATLAERGFFPAEWLSELDQSGSRLPKHVDRFKLPGIDVSSGALGQGLSIAVGMALAARIDGKDTRFYVVMGDGECNSGQVWEAAMAASKYHLDAITGIVDRNCCQVDGTSDDVMPLEPFASKWESFGWHVLCAHGHDVSVLIQAMESARAVADRPSVIIANTMKGKGVSFMECRYEWHSGKVTREMFETGMTELQTC